MRLRISFMQLHRTMGASWSEDGLRLTPIWSVLSPALYLYRTLCLNHYTPARDGSAELLDHGDTLLGR
jgi:hypothetical protein